MMVLPFFPELATVDLRPSQLQLLREFKKPSPMREVSIVVHRDFVKKKLVEIFEKEIIASIPEKIKKNKGEVIPI